MMHTKITTAMKARTKTCCRSDLFFSTATSRSASARTRRRARSSGKSSRRSMRVTSLSHGYPTHQDQPMKETPPAKLTIQEVASLLRCCRGKIPRFVYEGKLPAPDDNGRFDRIKLYQSIAWRTMRRDP